jgi:hypothetical protein
MQAQFTDSVMNSRTETTGSINDLFGRIDAFEVGLCEVLPILGLPLFTNLNMILILVGKK